MIQNVEVEEERVDERSVEDLLTFINGGDGGTSFPPPQTLLSNTFLVFFFRTCCNFLHCCMDFELLCT